MVLAYQGAIDEQQRGSAKHRAVESYRGAHVIRHMGTLRVDAITEDDLQSYATARRHDSGTWPGGDRPIRPASKATTLDELAALRRACRQQGVRVPPRTALKGWPSDARPPRSLLEREVEALVEAGHELYPWLGYLIQFAAWCPRRPVAIFALERPDCARAEDQSTPRRDVKIYVRRDKGGIGRGWAPLATPALEALRGRLEQMGDSQGLVWTSAQGLPLDAPLFGWYLDRAAEMAEVADVRPYDLRKHGASAIYRRTGSLEVTRRYTGHATTATLLRYVSASEEEADDYAEELDWTTRRSAPEEDR